MAYYVCKNKECPKFEVEQRPSGTSRFLPDGTIVFSGSKCQCGEEMDKITEPVSNAISRMVIKNWGDGRNS